MKEKFGASYAWAKPIQRVAGIFMQNVLFNLVFHFKVYFISDFISMLNVR
jgi:hypothetical protein